MDVIAPINPFQRSERLTIQKGVFLCAGDVKRPFQQSLQGMSGYKENVVRLVLPRRLRLDALRNLYEMGMTRAVLFPRLDGFAQSLDVYDPLIRKYQARLRVWREREFGVYHRLEYVNGLGRRVFPARKYTSFGSEIELISPSIQYDRTDLAGSSQ
ncbi:MAG: hypothetical protein HYY45_02240 [Deltaproteobacteria bacterium]|nr:hypothetical protein [Deltaproteobacteria bacterium]